MSELSDQLEHVAFRVDHASLFRKRTQCAGANHHLLFSAIDQQRGFLQIRLETPLGLVVGVADVVACLGTLARNRAFG